jgi:hypothetical protein
VAPRATWLKHPMANPQRPGLLSVFDDMLAQSKKRFDDHFRGGRSPAGEPVAGSAAFAGLAVKAAPATAAPSVRPDPDSPVTRLMNERFGNDWRYEITEQRRDGDEAIVLCKLFLGKEGAVRSQFGRAKISEGPVAGYSGGVRFKIGSAGAEQGERDAFRRATEAALMNCADLA